MAFPNFIPIYATATVTIFKYSQIMPLSCKKMNKRINDNLQKLSTHLKIKIKLLNIAYNACHDTDSAYQSDFIYHFICLGSLSKTTAKLHHIRYSK